MNIGELSHAAYKDTNNYCAYDIGDEMVKDIEAQVFECAHKHRDTFDGNEFCVVMLIVREPLLCNVLRRKFYAWPFLPKPRTSQTVWLYSKGSDTVRMLWCLPYADTMATLATVIRVHPAYANMQRWSRAFYTREFWPKIREEHGITMLSEEEHVSKRIGEKGTQSLRDDISPNASNPFDAMRFNTEQIANA